MWPQLEVVGYYFAEAEESALGIESILSLFDKLEKKPIAVVNITLLKNKGQFLKFIHPVHCLL